MVEEDQAECQEAHTVERRDVEALAALRLGTGRLLLETGSPQANPFDGKALPDPACAKLPLTWAFPGQVRLLTLAPGDMLHVRRPASSSYRGAHDSGVWGPADRMRAT